MSLIGPEFWNQLNTAQGTMYLLNSGELAKPDDTPDVACFDLRSYRTDGSWFGPKGYAAAKILFGVVLVLFLFVLVLGVIIGLFAYSKTDANGDSRYDIFFGQGLTASIGGAIFWFIGMASLMYVAGSITRNKLNVFNLLNDKGSYNNKLAAYLKQTKDSIDSLTW